MIARYTRPEMGRIWSEENKYRQWLEVELATSETLGDLGVVPADAAMALRKHAGFSVDRIAEIERIVRHDVIAFTTAVAESMSDAGAPEASRWFHYGMTSNDVVDTAQALQIQQASAQILAILDEALDILKRRAFEFENTPCIGRTHGIHAEPYTFGLKIALWYDELRRNRERFARATDEIRVGKISGAVGTFGHITPDAEEGIMRRLGLKPAAIASQVISRDLHANYCAALALIAATCEKVALEIRHLQRTEVREAEEPFAAGQKGSSAMPHKRNPVTCEQICGLARLVRSNVQAAYENIALWHERDISHSSVERVILPDSTILVDYLLAKTAWLVDGMVVSPERMQRNLEATRGLVFSGQLLLDLAAAGMLREEAYQKIQAHAMATWGEEGDLRARIETDPEIRKFLTYQQIGDAFSASRQLENVGRIFERVFGGHSGSRHL
jgi:adenylosuccinate lyase